MTIEQKAWNIAHETSPGIKDTASQHSDREEAARLGIIEGLEMAAKVADAWGDSPTGYRIAQAIRALIEEQKV